jgi:phospholipid/cholesterol/gamma-HCH transport system ATP-binding protein
MLTLSSVSLAYDGNPVLFDISLDIKRGEFVSIIGGSGKSSLLKVLGGIEPPQEGLVLYDGTDIYRANDRKYSELQKSSGFLFQDAALLANLSIFENVALPLRYHCRVSEHEIRSQVLAVFEQLAFEIKSDQRPAGFPLSIRKMVGLARAIVLKPEILFLDEPTDNVDHTIRETVIKTLLDLKCASKITGVIVSQDLDLVTLASDRIIVLDKGRIIMDNSIEQVFNSPDKRVRRYVDNMGGESETQAMHTRLDQRDGKEGR